ncbi:ATP-binding protein [Amorphoplanes nipponensis]|uniref:ATP-binding protein n=1 Tax=Actinoplanes nipponensis TaxID=135950 RepID=A0A919JRE9_9ACTN|nr:SbcC/MukB-like Walker B domain-containing protein [Actinoplanes nipponensis]GIE51594.1 ATP-binding protein [Actinoplanes nipponensis]
MTISEHEQPPLLAAGPLLYQQQPAAGQLPFPVTRPTPPSTDGLLQWRAESFQLVNWGGFEGQARFDFHRGATLISGASGTGKSTLLDAYIALMMPADTPFNGASNDAVTGRARSAEQRSLLSYLRGQTDTTADEHGRERPKLLRGAGRPTWGAVAMTFVDDHDRRFTALRAYFVPARAAQVVDIVMRMATIDGRFDLTELAGYADEQFQPRLLKAAFPGLLTHTTYASFAARLHTQLGIGANGDGEKALRLLVRIQAGHQIRTVDELYKEMVLERPATYEAADRAISHFDDLEAAYLAMHTEQQKADLLAPITAKHTLLQTAHTTVEQINTFGPDRTGDTPILLWSLRREDRLLAGALDANQREQKSTAAQLTSAVTSVNTLEKEHSAAAQAHREAGGGQLEDLAQQINQEQQRRDERLARRAVLAERTTALDAPLADQDAFAALQQQAAVFLDNYPQAAHDLTVDRDAIMARQLPLLQRRTVLTEERASLAGRAGRVPKHLDDMRREVAHASGIDVADLPFLAELIDVPAEHVAWRTAIETVLGASARLLLVPKHELAAFSAAIDPLRLKGRLTFEGVPTGDDGHVERDPDRIAGKLLFKESPYSGWVRRHLSEPARNALCVTTPEQLNSGGYRVTLAGQTRNGSRGTHGRNDQANIIGFSNTETLADIDRELGSIASTLGQIDRDLTSNNARRTDLDDQRSAYDAIYATVFTDIDVVGSDERIEHLHRARRAVLDADDRLQELQTRIEQLHDQLEGAREHRYRVKQHADELHEHAETLTDRHATVSADLQRLGSDQHVVLTAEQAEVLDEHFVNAVRPDDPSNLKQFITNLARLRQRLLTSAESARRQITSLEADLAAIFTAYLVKFDDPNLGRTAASYPDYAAILDAILTTGLHERREEWRRRLMAWSGEDLVPLAGSMEASIEEIEERLEPINAILHELPFGANRDRLRINLRRTTPETVAQFRRDLRALSSAATRDLPEQLMQQRFQQLQQFMGRLRRRNDPRAIPELSNRDQLLDVRRHVAITAERYDAAGQLLSIHSSLGGKSGGESQELVAFIVGAALRFRLGDELRSRPRFAPVFLDEGFVKSDAEFAGRAVQAWKGLGFQLIVGAPLDKVTALEPHMDELLAITKNTNTHYSFVTRISDIDQAALIPRRREPLTVTMPPGSSTEAKRE